MTLAFLDRKALHFAVACAVLLACVPLRVSAYGIGAPSSACTHGYAGSSGTATSTSHGTLQSGNGGFAISFNPSINDGYLPDTEYDGKRNDVRDTKSLE